MNIKANKLNIIISIVFKIVLIIFSFVLRRIFISYLGIELQGLTTVFTSILGFLGLADLGIGMAINYAMYKPISEKDHVMVGALYGLYKRIYGIIGAVILICGILVLPFLKGMCSGYSGNANIYFAYFLTLFAAVISYLYAAENSLIQAHQLNYITILISSGAVVIQHVIEIIVLVFFRSYYLYLFCKIVLTGLQYFVYKLYVNDKFKHIICNRKHKIDRSVTKNIIKNIKALVLHKIGSIVVFNLDSLIISTMLGVGILGYYSNYQTIITAEVGVLSLLFTPLTAGIGAMIVEKGKESYHFYEFLHQINYSFAFISFFGTYTVINYLITIWLGESFVMDNSIVLIITANYFVDFMRKSNAVFKDAAGLFYPDRYKCIVEAAINLVLSIVLCKYIGFKGVIIATIITNLCITLIIEPLVVFRHLFQKPILKFYIRQYAEIVSFFAALYLFYKFGNLNCNNITSAATNLIVSILLSISVIIVSALTNKGFTVICKEQIHKQKNKLGKAM